MKHNKELKGILQAITSAVLFGLMPFLTKVIYSFGANFVSTSFYRTSLPLVFVLILAVVEDKSIRISFKQLIYLVIASIFFVSTSLTLYNSYNYINSGIATTIHFAYPIIIFIISTFIMKTRANILDIFCIITVSIGLIMIVNLKQGYVDIRGILLAAISAFTYSFYSVLLSVSVIKRLSSLKILFYINLFSSLFIVLFSKASGNRIVLSYNLKEWIFIIFYSLIITVGATLLYQKSLRNIGAVHTSILSCLEPVTSIIVGIIFLAEKVFINQIFAIILIIGSTIFIVKNQIKKPNNL